MPRTEQVNELLKKELAVLINRELALNNGLITISYVDCSPDLSGVKIGVSVLPENLAGTVLARLKKSSGQFSQILKKKTRLRKIPKFNWRLDTTESQAAEIEKILAEIKKEK